jgi:hypothetical protein
MRYGTLKTAGRQSCSHKGSRRARPDTLCEKNAAASSGISVSTAAIEFTGVIIALSSIVRLKRSNFLLVAVSR